MREPDKKQGESKEKNPVSKLSILDLLKRIVDASKNTRADKKRLGEYRRAILKRIRLVNELLAKKREIKESEIKRINLTSKILELLEDKIRNKRSESNVIRAERRDTELVKEIELEEIDEARIEEINIEEERTINEVFDKLKSIEHLMDKLGKKRKNA